MDVCISKESHEKGKEKIKMYLTLNQCKERYGRVDRAYCQVSIIQFSGKGRSSICLPMFQSSSWSQNQVPVLISSSRLQQTSLSRLSLFVIGWIWQANRQFLAQIHVGTRR